MLWMETCICWISVLTLIINSNGTRATMMSVWILSQTLDRLSHAFLNFSSGEKYEVCFSIPTLPMRKIRFRHETFCSEYYIRVQVKFLWQRDPKTQCLKYSGICFFLTWQSPGKWSKTAGCAWARFSLWLPSLHLLGWSSPKQRRSHIASKWWGPDLNQGLCDLKVWCELTPGQTSPIAPTLNHYRPDI